MTHLPQRGFTLLVSIILSSVALALSLSLLDIAYKQVTLSLTAKQSAVAFSNADAGLECALYYDQKNDSFNYSTAPTSFTITCASQTTTVTMGNPSGGSRTATFSIPCVGGGSSAVVSVVKASTASTRIYSDGYNTCSPTDARRIERGLKASY
jgi:Tfp pilus assembly protein PilX